MNWLEFRNCQASVERARSGWSRIGTMASDPKPNFLLGLDRVDLKNLVAEMDQPSYRADQIFDAVYRQKLSSVEQISTLPTELRRELAARGFTMGWPRIVN